MEGTVAKIISTTDADALMQTLVSTPTPPVGPGQPTVHRSRVTITLDELPNVGPE